MSLPTSTQSLIERLVQETRSADPVAAIRHKARAVITQYCGLFGEPTMPLNMEAVASMLGIARCDTIPVHSQDAELVPDGTGGMRFRVNSDRPETRQRFSIAHEICHTFFPDYEQKVWCRPDSRFRNRDNPDDFLEMLCDIGGAELLMPLPWFSADACAVTTGEGLIGLSKKYLASREAVLRRVAELHPDSVAAVYFSWKLKPAQIQAMPREGEANLFDTDPIEEARLARKLRIDYSIPSPAFQQSGHYLPTDKSVENTGPLYEAASTGQPCEGECELTLGQATGRYGILAVPLWTSHAELGPRNENAVAAIVRPISLKTATKKPKMAEAASVLFGMG